jgi:plasmid stability protein
MATIQVKHVPDDVHATLRRRAAEAGQSLQEYVLATLTEQARQPTSEEFWAHVGTHAGGRLSAAQAVEWIREDRDSR